MKSVIGGCLQRLVRRFRNAQKRARYWSGTPSFGGNRYVPQRARQNADLAYELAMNDQESLAALIADSGGSVRVIDYDAEFRARFSRAMAKRAQSPNASAERNLTCQPSR